MNAVPITRRARYPLIPEALFDGLEGQASGWAAMNSARLIHDFLDKFHEELNDFAYQEYEAMRAREASFNAQVDQAWLETRDA